jgi:hypothetical protein
MLDQLETVKLLSKRYWLKPMPVVYCCYCKLNSWLWD